MLCEALDIAKETYFAILLDRATSGVVMVASAEGGMDIEEVYVVPFFCSLYGEARIKKEKECGKSYIYFPGSKNLILGGS